MAPRENPQTGRDIDPDAPTPGQPRDAGSPKPQPAAKQQAKSRWPRRLRIGLLVLVGLLVVLAALAPTLASTAAGRRLIVGQVNGMLVGTVSIDGLSVSWFSPTRIEGLKVLDPEGRTTLAVPQLTLDRSVWQLLWSSDDLGRLRVVSPQADLYFDAQWQPSIQRALQMKQPSQEPFEGPKLTVELEQGEVRLVRHDGAELRVANAGGTFGMDTLNELRMKLAATLASGGQISADGQLSDLNVGGHFSPAQTRGQMQVRTEPAIELGPVIEFFAAGTRATGQATVTADLNLQPGQGGGDYVIKLTNLSAARGPAANVKPADLTLAGKVDVRDGRLVLTSNVQSPLATLDVDADYAVSAPAPAVTADQIADALIHGRSVELPDFSLTARGRVDLARASETIPGLLSLREGVNISSGYAELKGLAIRGGKSPSAQGSAHVELTTTGPAGTNQWQPMDATFKLVSDGTVFRLEQGRFNSSFATLEASGPLRQFSAEFKADLAAARKQFANVLALDDVVMGGTLAGRLSGGVAGEATQLQLDLQTDKVQYGVRGGSNETPPPTVTAKLNWSGQIEPKQQRLRLPGTLTLNQLNVDGTDLLLGETPTLRHDLLLPGPQDRLDVNTFALTSKALTVNLAGQVEKVSTVQQLKLDGDYTANWPELNRIVTRFSPELGKTLAMQGQSQGPINVSGPLSQPQVTPGYRDLDAATAVGWQDGSRAFGLTLGGAKLQPTMNKARIVLPATTTSANGGTLRLGATVDLAGQSPTLLMPGSVDVLENVGINQEVGREILSRVLPLFAETSKLEGKLNLTLRDVSLPLDERITTAGKGSGRLDLSDLRLSPTGAMAELIKLGGVAVGSDAYPVRLSAVDFDLRDGGVRYENLTLYLGEKLDLKFRGVVRFDNTLDLVVSVPVKPELLERLGVKGLSGEYARLLADVRVEIPIVGSREKPRLDLSKIDVKALVAEAIKRQGGQLLPGLLPRR